MLKKKYCSPPPFSPFPKSPSRIQKLSLQDDKSTPQDCCLFQCTLQELHFMHSELSELTSSAASQPHIHRSSSAQIASYPHLPVDPIQLVQFSHSVTSDSLRPHELQHARPPCPSPTPGVHSDSCASSQ